MAKPVVGAALGAAACTFGLALTPAIAAAAPDEGTARDPVAREQSRTTAPAGRRSASAPRPAAAAIPSAAIPSAATDRGPGPTPQNTDRRPTARFTAIQAPPASAAPSPATRAARRATSAAVPGSAPVPARAAAATSPALSDPRPAVLRTAVPAAAATAAAAVDGVSTPIASAADTDWFTANLITPISDFINGALLLIRRTFFNEAPTATPIQAMVRPSGQVWGFLAGSDPEGEQITYTVTTAPQFGTVTIDDHGTYSYTPGAGFTGTDTFTATLETPGFHINVLDLFGNPSPQFTVTVRAGAADPAGTVTDGFDGSAGSLPNPAIWSLHTGPWLDGGVQTYTNSPDNVALDGQGHLLIRAQDTVDGYTSARVVSEGNLDMLYGAMTARIKLPSGQGIWPAFWMLGSTYDHDTWDALGPTGWPGCGEIDIIETVSNDRRYYVTLHGPQGTTDYYGGVDASNQVVGTSGYLGDLSLNYHDYWVIRREDQIVIGMDDQMLADFVPADLPEGGEWVFNRPMYAIMQVAVGGTWAGLPDDTTPWPATMLVDSFKYTPLA